MCISAVWVCLPSWLIQTLIIQWPRPGTEGNQCLFWMLWASALGKMIFDREDPLSNGGHEAGDLQISELWFMQERSFSHSLGIPHKCSRCLGCPFHISWNIHCTSEDASEPWSSHLSGYSCWSWPEVVTGMGSPRDMPSWVSQQWGDEKVEGELMQPNYTL